MDLGRPLIAIAAVARNRGIGLNNKLPWRIPEDFAFFKSTTMGQVLLMGRKTYESIGRPLPGRTTVVLSRSGFTAPGVIVAKDWQEAALVEPTKTLFLAGGAALYAEALPWCAELILTPKSGGMEYARDLADKMVQDGKGRVLDQFANADNPRIHFETTGPELWEQTGGRITHFVSAMGTTGTITGVSRFLKEKNPAVRIVGAQPSEGSRIPGIRKWPEAYLPKIYDPSRVDELIYVSQADAEDMARRLAAEEGLFCGISAAGACWAALQLAQNLSNATIVFIVCDRGDRYLSTGVFPA